MVHPVQVMPPVGDIRSDLFQITIKTNIRVGHATYTTHKSLPNPRSQSLSIYLGWRLPWIQGLFQQMDLLHSMPEVWQWLELQYIGKRGTDPGVKELGGIIKAGLCRGIHHHSCDNCTRSAAFPFICPARHHSKRSQGTFHVTHNSRRLQILCTENFTFGCTWVICWGEGCEPC